MIRNSFLHIPGIGPKTEQRLWESGIHCWDDFTVDGAARLQQSRTDAIRAALELSRRQMDSGHPKFFSERLPANQHWRFFPEFREATAYLDIETTGLNPWACEITTIALYDGRSISYYVNGVNLEDFLTSIGRFSVIVTYNGKSFDVPFIEEKFGVTLDHAHIDLRYILASLGYRGGLKSCEYQLGLGREDHLKDIDGYFAVLLWYDYARNQNRRALDTLLAYNIQDTVNLEMLMVIAYNMKVSGTPFQSHQLPKPSPPLVPFTVDMKTVDRVKREYGF